MSLKKFIHSILAWAINLFHNLEKEEKRLLPIMVAIVNRIKAFEDTGVGDIITKLIPGDLDDKLYALAKKATDRAFVALTVLTGADQISDPVERYKFIIGKLKLSNDDGKNVVLHGFASIIIESLSDGKITWNEALHIADVYFKEVANSTPAIEIEAVPE